MEPRTKEILLWIAIFLVAIFLSGAWGLIMGAIVL